jgi:hypothetical protein
MSAAPWCVVPPVHAWWAGAHALFPQFEVAAMEARWWPRAAPVGAFQGSSGELQPPAAAANIAASLLVDLVRHHPRVQALRQVAQCNEPHSISVVVLAPRTAAVDARGRTQVPSERAALRPGLGLGGRRDRGDVGKDVGSSKAHAPWPTAVVLVSGGTACRLAGMPDLDVLDDQLGECAAPRRRDGYVFDALAFSPQGMVYTALPTLDRQILSRFVPTAIPTAVHVDITGDVNWVGGITSIGWFTSALNYAGTRGALDSDLERRTPQPPERNDDEHVVVDAVDRKQEVAPASTTADDSQAVVAPPQLTQDSTTDAASLGTRVFLVVPSKSGFMETLLRQVAASTTLGVAAEA